jgi:hypothetical protein
VHELVKQSTYTGAADARERCIAKCTHIFELGLEHRDHVFFHNYAFVVEVFDYVVMIGTVDANNDGLDGRVAFDKNACYRSVRWVRRRIIACGKANL